MTVQKTLNICDQHHILCAGVQAVLHTGQLTLSAHSVTGKNSASSILGLGLTPRCLRLQILSSIIYIPLLFYCYSCWKIKCLHSNYEFVFFFSGTSSLKFTFISPPPGRYPWIVCRKSKAKAWQNGKSYLFLEAQSVRKYRLASYCTSICLPFGYYQLLYTGFYFQIIH